MQRSLERPKSLVPAIHTEDVWMAGAVPDWATGGTGFTQQDVAVWALCYTNAGTCTLKAG